MNLRQDCQQGRRQETNRKQASSPAVFAFQIKAQATVDTKTFLTGWGNEMFTVSGLISEAAGDAEEHSSRLLFSPTDEPPPI